MVLRIINLALYFIFLGGVFSPLISQPVFSDTPYITWSPDRNLLAVSDRNTVVQIVDVSANQVLNSFTSIQYGSGTKPTWSPDGTKIVLSNDFDAEVWETPWDKTQVRLVSRYQYYAQEPLQQPDVPPYKNIWSPDGQQIATIVGGAIDIWDVQNGKRLNRFPGKQGVTHAISWSNDGKLISAGSLGDVMLWNIETGTPEEFFTVTKANAVPNPSALSLAWSPDNEKVAVGSEDNTIRIWNTGSDTSPVISHEYDPSTLKIPSLLEMAEVPVISVAWSPDGRYIASGEQGGKVRLYDATTGTLLDTIEVDPNAQIFSVDWSPYGGQLAFSSLSAIFPTTTRSMAIRSVAGGTVQVIVPYASLEQLQTISGQCLADAPASLSANNFLKRESVSKLTLADLSRFVNRVKTLPDDAIPPACAADLIAVAEALIAQ